MRLLPACLLLGLTGCGLSLLDGKADADDDDDDAGDDADIDGGGGGGGSGGSTDPCGRYTGDRFFVASLTIGVDPVDFEQESWDWDGTGIADFWSQYDELIEFALVIASEGTYQRGSLDLAVQLADAFAPLIMSEYVSPDLRLEEFWVDDDSDEFLGSVDNFDNTIWMRFADFEIRLPDPDRWWWLQFYDRDLAFDDYAGWMAFDQWTFQQLADCGQATWVLTDADMDLYETRVRFVELEVESW